MSSSGSGAPDSIANSNFDGKIIAPERTEIGTAKSARTPIVVPGLDVDLSATPSSGSSNKENDSASAFDLLKNEEEERLIGEATPLQPIDGVWTTRSPPVMARGNGNGASRTAPSLRSVSLPKGADEAALGLTAAHVAMTSPQLGRANSLSSVNEPPCTLAHPAMTDKKAMKVVSEYYKKQNELLENFKADNEQIQVFQKTRTRQRLASTNSAEPEEPPQPQPKQAADAAAPILQQDGEEDVSVVVSSAKRTGGGTGAGGKGGGGGMGALSLDMDQNLEEEGLLGEKEPVDDEGKCHRLAAARLSRATLAINLTLAILKAAASFSTGSLSIISSLVDSLVDITSGLLILYSTRAIRKRDPYSYPRGRTRLEPMILVIISVVMGFASLQLILESIKRMAKQELEISMDAWSAGIMVITIIAKSILVIICKKYDSDPSIRVLAQDHRNDCVSNTVALLCAGLSPKLVPKAADANSMSTTSILLNSTLTTSTISSASTPDVYINAFNIVSPQWLQWLDPLGAILVSAYIIQTWWGTGKEHVKMLSGKSAEPEFINRIIKVCIDHDPRIEHIDTVYVYHYGMKFLVEVHIVLDENMPLKVAHDISESLQINIESLPDVERAFVHTDYEYEHLPADEHKVV
ncbi:hypothetical protein PMAYCL1PPCAC_14137 [Pristionchus mayeri]|uniref:Cation efflux protein cytoplasmic domain-containing protein n=1 Tax=Pristionchus mayeri TaxID=1317129 RepID=A0AAN4ZMA7_9BILA|nr:hypothetical protein PMAYCL1PPCAC_14137 [Pristionchus mayeri]